MKERLWFGVYGKAYQGSEPAFFDEAFPWREYLEEQFPAIREAVAPLLENDEALEPYFDAEIQFPPKNWKTIAPIFWGKKTKDYDHFAELLAILKPIPRLCGVSLNLLEPHSRILPHFGDTNAVYRVHLGIQVPKANEKCTFTVSGETRAWEEGKTLVFLDANTHEAVNDTDEKRYILLLDVIRPEFAHLRKWVCWQVLAVFTLYWLVFKLSARFQALLRNSVARIPEWLLGAALLPLRLAWLCYWPFVKADK